MKKGYKWVSLRVFLQCREEWRKYNAERQG